MNNCNSAVVSYDCYRQDCCKVANCHY